MKFTMYSDFAATVKKSGWEAAADKAVKLGFSAVEMFDVTGEGADFVLKSVEEAKAAREILESRGLKMACYSVFANGYNSTLAVEQLKHHAEMAAACGSPYLHHTILPWFQPEENLPEFDDAIDCAVDVAEEVANHAKKFGVTCIYEDQGFYLNGIDGFAAFFYELKTRCSNVGVCGDVGNSLFIDVAAEDFFRAFKDDIVHVHIKDYTRVNSEVKPGDGWYVTRGGAWLKDCMIGQGVVNFDECMAVLKEIGYDGTLALESTVPTIQDAIANCKEYFKKYE